MTVSMIEQWAFATAEEAAFAIKQREFRRCGPLSLYVGTSGEAHVIQHGSASPAGFALAGTYDGRATYGEIVEDARIAQQIVSEASA